jgi:hypothetical protein
MKARTSQEYVVDLDRLNQVLTPGVRAAALLVLLILLLGRIPILKFLILPFSIFAVVIHELAHALATVLSGGRFERLSVWYNPTRNEVEGAAYSRGGDGCLIINAGYVGTILFGALLLVVAVSDLSARLVVLVLGLGLLVVTALFIRGAFGVVSGLLIGLTLILISRQQPEIISKGVLWVMAVTMIVDSFVHLIFIPTDSQLLQKRTGINFGYWIVLWWVIAGLILVWALNRAYGVPLPWTLLGRGV